ncbi:MAG: argininosuccinate lyase [Phycisphaerae bacterium]|nr:argininosuccinate lyase [Phycisphaerae bacterium]
MPHKQPMEAKKHVKSWHGRLSAEADSATAALLASLDVDVALWKYDIAGSLAHAQMLREQALLTAADLAKIKKGLHAVEKDIAAGRIHMPIELEDIHMVIEADLVRRIGDAGRKLHTARSRNDQIALDLRLWARDAADDLSAGIVKLQKAFLSLVQAKGAAVFPSYTHLQRAQPIVLGHALLAHVEMLQRDVERLADARKRINVCPLGSGAVAGTSLPIDRARTAELLGFGQFSRNSIDATSDRDFLAELCFACSMLAVHLSRWAEDWILYSSNEFGLLELHDAFCTSSSMMPQKKNADTLELIRGKSAGCLAQLVGMLTLLKGLPLAYNRDLQDDKRFAFETVGMMKQVLAVAPGIVETVTVKQPDLAGGFLDATSLAEYLVEKNVPFRTAHGIVGKIVAQAERQNLTLAELPLDALQKHSRKIQSDVYRHLGAENVVKRYAPDGAGGAKQLAAQLRHWKRLLG